jgi:hypothetical protein
MLTLCPIDRGYHRLWLLGHVHDDVNLTLGQGIQFAIQGLDHSDRGELQGGYDSAKGDSAREDDVDKDDLSYLLVFYLN